MAASSTDRSLPTEGEVLPISPEQLFAWARLRGLELHHAIVELLVTNGCATLRHNVSIQLADGTKTSGISLLDPSSFSATGAEFPPWAIPIMRDGVGNFFLAPSDGANAVFFFDHDIGEAELLCRADQLCERILVPPPPPLSDGQRLKRGDALDDVLAASAQPDDLLRQAVFARREDVVHELLRRGAPADRAVAAAARSVSLLKVLARVLPIDQPGPGGETALIVASRAGAEDSVRWLLENGADPRIKDDSGLTAYDHAAHRRHGAIAKILEAHANKAKA